jgi:hypothetical protein
VIVHHEETIVSHDNDRDASLERLLSRTAPTPSRAESAALRRASPAGKECLDAETLAAWFEGSLRGAERTAAERHAADCAHCQAMLAAMVRTEPAPPVRAGWWSRTVTLRWALPLTAGIAVAIWLLAPPDNRGIRPDTVAEAPAPPASDSAARQVPPVVTPAPQRSEGGVSRDRAAEPASPSPSARDEFVPQQPRSRSTRTGEKATGAVSSAAAPPPTEARRDEASRAETRSAAAPPSLAESEMRQAKQLASPSVEAVSPAPAFRWRVGAAGLVQRSIDGGATWQTQSSGVPADLLAASAPSPTVCWAVGRAGTVIVTTDGLTWRRLTFPDTADLVTVVASSALAADVTAADGRKFRTADAGRSWVVN